MAKQIRFEPDRLERQTGEVFKVPVIVEFDRPTRVRNIRATFHGAELTKATYTTTSTDGKGRVTTQTHTATEFNNFVNQEFLLMGEPRKGFFSRLTDSLATWFGGGQNTLLGPGEERYEVELMIPKESPPTFKGKKCEVFYKLDVAVDLPIRYDWANSVSFEVPAAEVPFADSAPVHVKFPDGSGRSFWDKMFGKDVTLNLAVDRDTVACGETALAMLTVETSEPLQLKTITMTLIGTESTRAKGHSDSHQHRHELGVINSPSVIQNLGVQEFEFEIQFPQIEGPFSQSGLNFDVTWKVEVQLQVPWAKDPIISVPIKLLSKPATASSKQVYPPKKV